jgi:two-component system alkaline phosphatase synthesis response regulator PhoP
LEKREESPGNQEMIGKRVLVVDDDVKTVELVKLYLNRDGYKVLTAYNGTDALRLAREGHPDLIVLDLMLPGIDGLHVCRTIRSESDVPIIMLTAKTTEEDRLIGLDLGADDYVPKPFSPKELAARVRAVLRRLPGETIQRGPVEVRHGKLAVNFPKHEASLGGRPLNLSPIEFKLLGALVREPERVFSRAELIEKALGYDFEGFDRTIDVHIFNLRRKLEPDPNQPRYIKTAYGIGYKFIGDVQ